MPRKSNENCELTILGSGSGIPVIDRSSSAILVNADGRLHLLDCGEGITSTLLKRKIPYNRIETIFITHGHPDHCSGLPLLLQLMHVNKREKDLKIFLPEEALDPTMRYLWHCYLFPEHMTFQYHLLKLDDQNPHSENGVEITAYSNSHLISYRGIILENSYANMMQCYSLSLKVGEKKIVYSSDLASAGDLGDFARGADVLIVEGLHIEPEELFRVIAEWKVGKVVMTHFAPRWNGKEKGLVALAKRFGVRNFKLAEDGMKVR